MWRFEVERDREADSRTCKRHTFHSSTSCCFCSVRRDLSRTPPSTEAASAYPSLTCKDRAAAWDVKIILTSLPI